MLPLVARESKFVFSSDVEAAQYSANAALVAQLTDSVRCWLSHISDVRKDYMEFIEWCDRENADLDLSELASRTHAQETSLSFCSHVEKDAVAACIRVLKLVTSDGIPGLLAQLAVDIKEIKALHEGIVNAMTYAEAAAEYMKPGFAWDPENGMDTAPALFSALRAMWVCCPLLGSQNPRRFEGIVRAVVASVGDCMHRSCGTLLQAFIDAPFKATKIKSQLVGAQETIVTVQEQFHEMRSKLSASGVTNETDHLFFSSGDDESMFRHLNWQYFRITGILQIIDALVKDMNKVGSALTDPFVDVDLLDPDAMYEERFAKLVNIVETSDAPDPNAVLERMGNKRTPVKKTFAPRVNFSQLTKNLVIHVSFNPPVVTIIGGPVSEAFLDGAQMALPLCCSNTIAKSVTRKQVEPMFKEIAPNVRRLTLDHQWCEVDTTTTHFFATLLDLLETEDAWSMVGSMSGVVAPEGFPAEEEAKYWYTFNFKRQRPKEESPRRPQPAHAGLALLAQPPYVPENAAHV
jgi:hypothetical protein